MSTGRLGAGDTAIQPTIFDAKGDLLTATAGDTPARIAVGNSGETLVADSSTSTGLRWQGDYAAGKNKIINGDFAINQRGFTSNTSSGTFGFDRWRQSSSGGTTTTSAQTFTLGAAPVAGYESTNFLQIESTGQTLTGSFSSIQTKVEDVRIFANQTVSFSFWAKADSGTPGIAVEITQIFGSGGSSAVTTFAGKVTISTSWARYSVSVLVPSISGKTVGAGSNLTFTMFTSAGTDFNARTGSLGIQTATIGIWGVQAEAGSVATAFQTATGTLAGELAACQRYYFRLGNNNAAVNRSICSGAAYASNDASGVVQFPSTMRTTPTLDATSGTNYYGFLANSATDGFNSFTLGYADTTSAIIYNASQISQTAGHGGVFITQSASASVAFSSEL